MFQWPVLYSFSCHFGINGCFPGGFIVDGLCQHVEEIEAHIRRTFAHRIRDFRISMRDDTLELEGRSCSYHVKQIVQKAVTDTTHLRIRANNIRVDPTNGENESAKSVAKGL